MPVMNFDFLDMRDIALGDLLDGEITQNTSTSIIVVGDGFLVEFVGTGFTYSGDDITGGTLRELYVNSDDANFQLTELSIPATQMVNWILNNQTTTALTSIFSGNDRFIGNGQGSSYLMGYGGADLFNPGGRNDTMVGGTGNDMYVVQFNGAPDVIIENAGEGIDQVNSYNDYTLPENVEILRLLDYPQLSVSPVTGTGNALGNYIKGNARNNILNGLAGDDFLTGQGGSDTLNGGDGNDFLWGDAGSDTLNGGAGSDTANFTGASTGFTFGNSNGAITVSKGGETDTLTSVELLDFDDGVFTSAVFLGDATVNGTSGADTLLGWNYDDTLHGGAGNDVLDGRAGEDKMYGGAGNDTYVFDDRGDRAYESANGGVDLVRTRVTYSMQDHLENLTMFGTGNIGAIGNGLNNRIIGNEGNNVIKGGLGADRLEGGKGDDNYLANKEDQLIELANGGIDTVRTSDSWTLGTHFENLTLIGSSNTAASGNAKANIITGNSGNNVIYGGAGADTLKGGDGIDRFVYTAASDSTAANPDRMLDLRNNEIVDLRGVDANTNAAGDQAFTIVDAFTNVAGQMTITYDAATQTSTVRMDVNGDGVADMAIVMNGDKEDFAGWWL